MKLNKLRFPTISSIGTRVNPLRGAVFLDSRLATTLKSFPCQEFRLFEVSGAIARHSAARRTGLTEREAPRPALPVGDLISEDFAKLKLRLIAGSSGLRRQITIGGAFRPGLALAGGLEELEPGTLQILGRSEIAYLSRIPDAQRKELLQLLAQSSVACLVLAQGADPPDDLVGAVEERGVPLLSTRSATTLAIEVLGRFLEERLAPSVTIHGTCMDIYGVGVLILGESGVGKSESALELIQRGHRLIADDTVSIRRIGAVLSASGPELSRYHMEVRGLGIINIKDLFGVAAVRERKDIDLVIQLDPWRNDKNYDRLGLDMRTYKVLGATLPFIEMPVGPGRNLSILLEVAARHHMLRSKGYHPAKELAGKIEETLRRRS
jgi:HPr kinase/phosphorylase